MISPIFTYNIVVWDAYAKSDLKSWDSSHGSKKHINSVNVI